MLSRARRRKNVGWWSTVGRNCSSEYRVEDIETALEVDFESHFGRGCELGLELKYVREDTTGRYFLVVPSDRDLDGSD
jgi:hypothetical protein